MTSKRVLLVGAYERDNFGDLLFCLITRKLLEEAGHEVIVSSLIEGIGIGSYDKLLNTESFDYVWVVGGELGGVDVRLALSMSLPSELLDIYLSSNDSGKAEIRTGIGCPQNLDHVAYLPNLSTYPCKNTKLIINSVGLSGPGGIPNLSIEQEIRSICEAAYCISVRDFHSLTILSSFHKESFLSPDLVHSIPSVFELSSDRTNYIVFQIGEELFCEFGLDNIVNALKWVSNRLSYGIILLPSGLARHHDSFSQYVQIKTSLTMRGIPVELVFNRDPLYIAGLIAFSKLWIGSSLHGRIVACTYNVPRISLKNNKVSFYVNQWDPLYPCDMDLREFSNTIERTLLVNSEFTNSSSNSLQRQSYDNIRDLIARLT